jgi:hypothetical protein
VIVVGFQSRPAEIKAAVADLEPSKRAYQDNSSPALGSLSRSATLNAVTVPIWMLNTSSLELPAYLRVVDVCYL